MNDQAEPGAEAAALAAEAAFRIAAEQVQGLEARDVGGSELSDARRRRSDAALQWRRCATEWATMVPEDGTAKAALKRARQAASRFEMPSGGLKAKPPAE